MKQVRIDLDDLAATDRVVPEDRVSGGYPGNVPDGWKKTLRFTNRSLQAWHPRQLIEIGSRVVGDSVQLLGDKIAFRGMIQKQHQEPGETVGNGIGACEEEGQDLILENHAFILAASAFGKGIHELAEQITMSSMILEAGIDDAIRFHAQSSDRRLQPGKSHLGAFSFTPSMGMSDQADLMKDIEDE